MYCPECRSEFVEGVASCAACEVSLVAELPELDPYATPEGMAAMLEGKEVQAFMVANQVVLQEVQRLLGDFRIPSAIAGEAAEELEAAMHARFFLMVAEDQLDDARQVMADQWKKGVEAEGLMFADGQAPSGKGVEAEVAEDGAADCPACGVSVPPEAEECPDCGLFVGAAGEE